MKSRKFDKEYGTTYLKEKQFLDSCGIKYTFVKKIDGITYFKYKKTSQLYDCLSVFYKQFDEEI